MIFYFREIIDVTNTWVSSKLIILFNEATSVQDGNYFKLLSFYQQREKYEFRKKQLKAYISQMEYSSKVCQSKACFEQ